MELKKFKDLVDSLQEAKADITKSFKIKGVKVDIHKHKGQFEVQIDGDILDTYKTEKEAEMMAKQFVNQYKG
jgi:hypothetical protein